MNILQTLWERTENWFSVNALSVWNPSSSAGASEAEIAHAEAVIGVTFPEDFKTSYRLHNGGCPFRPWQDMMTLGNIVGTWEMFKEHWEQGYIDSFPDEPPGPVQGWHWRPKWIPFVWGGYGGEYVCLDLDPAPGGQIGQLILRTHESEPARLLVPSLETWLATFVHELETGKYLVDGRKLERLEP